MPTSSGRGPITVNPCALNFKRTVSGLIDLITVVIRTDEDDAAVSVEGKIFDGLFVTCVISLF